MSDPRSAQKKRILGDPAGCFAALHPERATGNEAAALAELAGQYREQARECKAGREQARELSARIGRAKRNGEPTANLLDRMRAGSRRLRSLEETLAGTEQRILAYFEPTAAAPAGAGPHASAGTARHYRGSPEDPHLVTITRDGCSRAEWNAYAADNPAASFYHLAEWQDVIRDSFGHEGHYYCARNVQGDLVGILPLIRLRSRLFGHFMVSMPYFNYGGAVADDPRTEQLLMEAASREAQRLGSAHVEFRDDLPRAGYPVREDKVNMILALPDDHQTLWKGFTPRLRAQIRRPQRENPSVRQGGPELLDDFYAVFSRNMRDLGTPVYDRNFFLNILEHFPDNCRLVVIHLDGRPVAAGFLAGFRERLEIPWASTLRSVNRLSMNMLLYWHVLRFAIEGGFQYFDFGRSSRDSGTFRFKQQWGARPRPLYWHYWLRDGSEPPALNPGNPKYALAINVWKRLPLPVTRWLGPRIVRNLP